MDLFPLLLSLRQVGHQQIVRPDRGERRETDGGHALKRPAFFLGIVSGVCHDKQPCESRRKRPPGEGATRTRSWEDPEKTLLPARPAVRKGKARSTSTGDRRSCFHTSPDARPAFCG